MKIKYLLLLIIGIFFFLSINLYGKDVKHVRFTAQPSKLEVKNGEKFSVLLTMKLDKHWHSYSLNEQIGSEGIGPSTTEITAGPKNVIVIAGKIKAPKPKIEYDSGFEMKVEMYYSKAEFEIILKAKNDINFNKDKAFINVNLELCDTASCLPSDDYRVTIGNQIYTPTVGLIEEADTSEIAKTDVDSSSSLRITSNETIKKSRVDATESQKEIESKKGGGILSFLWLAITAGALALLTPCVFPMVPITVSFFAKRAETTRGKGLRDALVYAFGIIITFTSLGFLFSVLFGASGIQDFAKSPGVYLFVAGIFLLFTFNLFGAYEIQMPAGLMNKLNTKSMQGKGVGSVILMGLTFSLASFSCTGPLVGAALIAASTGEWFHPIISMIAFSATLALPFFFLALFPSALSRLPKAGGWMNNMKVVLGFIVLATSLYFINNALLQWGGGLSREVFLSIWIAIFVMTTLYILGVFKLKLDSAIETIGSVRLIFALSFASITFYLVGGLFGMNLGELEAYVPLSEKPLIAASVADAASGTKTAETGVWLENYEKALVVAKAENKPIFIDFTGRTCTNCKKMEKNMFPKQNINSLLSKMVKVKLLTDVNEEPYISNKNFQLEKFNSVALPLYVILTPDGKVISTETYTRDEKKFIAFLNKAFKK
ncbi:MAG: hypothetical protein A2X61_14890 [Ignavibacteria bacterium GWB2_35_12]|nr:MAG: hypothetical protein A2X63_10940 [Ignavibacteria bacterium GWA2_35_8]OGU38366.1 MAG: hypothetical protein A2X61_14890 [Ignavibacteria bacterium GWB2_35_12]OGU94185.1 MAG: hypothetical protein A2220_01625 [Ignavibacteria bacterium RIFOXYA2_FULL_35_10]OGV23397.1 MAG: hypothetical protein A2475_06365 [Ignavibacteria bacterium RIFOXYC2_FULL_35_21]